MGRDERRAESKRDKKRGGSDRGQTTRWLNIDLSAEEKKEVASYAEMDEFSIEVFAALVDEGYRVTINYSDRASAFVASMFDNDPDSSTVNCALSGMGSTAYNAVAALLYKHAVKLSSDWTNEPTAATGEKYG